MFKSLKDVKYLDETPIGEGAFSSVYKVLHIESNQVMALKKIDVSELSNEDCNNLKLEIDIHKNLDHPNIIKFHGCLQRKQFVYILLENAENGTLFFYIDIKEGLPEVLAIRFFYETVLSIMYLHENNIWHRDIKPENLLLDKFFKVRLCDFGWCCKEKSNDDYRYV